MLFQAGCGSSGMACAGLGCTRGGGAGWPVLSGAAQQALELQQQTLPEIPQESNPIRFKSSMRMRAGFAPPKSPQPVLFAFPKCQQQARQRGKHCGNSQLVVPGFWCKTRGFQDSEQGRSPPPAAFCPDREREACACLATREGCDLASVLSGAERGAAGSQPADTAAGMHAGCVTGTIPKQAVLSSTCAWGHVSGVRPLTAGCAAAGEAGMCRHGIAPR